MDVEMSTPCIGVMKFPNEILEKISINMDPNSLFVVGQVCQKWSDVVQMIHEKAWKFITRVIMLKKDTIGPNFKQRGWIEGVHSIYQCKCINIERDLVIYKDMEQLNSDLELLELIDCDLEFLPNPSQSRIEAASRLAAAGILNSIRYLVIDEIDLTSIQYLQQLVSIVQDYLELMDVTKKDLLRIFGYVKCEKFFRFWNYKDELDDSEIESLAEALGSRVKWFDCCNCKKPFSYIQKYDGKGKCEEIEILYQVYTEEDLIDFESDWAKFGDWAGSREWTRKLKNKYYNEVLLHVQYNSSNAYYANQKSLVQSKISRKNPM